MSVPKVFNDAVHGTIQIHPLCVAVIDTPQFQRLRFIKQVGFVYFVYPAAAHNRFEHCIGVCHLAGQFARELKNRQPELQITDKDVLCVELAGLCHDLGHGPFSHLWEQFIKRTRPNHRWKHEESSVAMLDHLIETNNLTKEMHKYDLDEDDLTFIKEVITTHESDSDSSWPYKGRSREKGFLYQIVANNENGVDVDKWDYFMRDGHSLGLQVTFNHNRLMKFSRVINVSTCEIPNYKICFRDKEVTNLYDMFHARMMLHKKAYQHRIVKIIDTMLLDALILANEHVTYQRKDGKELALCDVVDDLEVMTYLNDSVFHKIHHNYSPHENVKRAKAILDNILSRHYYPRVGQTMPMTRDIKEEDLLKEVEANFPPGSRLKRDDLVVQSVVLNYGNTDRNPILRVGFYTKDEPNVCTSHAQDEMSLMLPTRWQETIFRLVCREYDPDLVEDARAAFSKACHTLRIPIHDRSKNGNRDSQFGNGV